MAISVFCRGFSVTAFAATLIALSAPVGAVNAPKNIGTVMALSQSDRTITHSVRIKPGVYVIPDADGKGAVRIAADNITVDFQGSTLSSCDVSKAKRDTLDGTGIDLHGRKNVTIKNAKVYGYRYNIRVMDSDEIKIVACDVSYGRAQRMMDHGIPAAGFLGLRSVGAWREYGAGIWLEKARMSTVRKCRGLNAQNGLLAVGSEHCLITDNDFSFNSGWGIGLYQSSDNIVSWNLTDFSVRPDRGRFGGDSASIAVANECNRNYFVGNSMTHGGDGFFLTNVTDAGYDPKAEVYAPKGNADDNVIAFNDGSWSPGNAFEGTFSYRNVYYKNLADDSNYGFWLGFSCDSLILDNSIRRVLSEGVAIEQGHGNIIEHNVIDGCTGAGVHLWSGTGKAREGVPSKNLEIRDNVIRNAKAAFDLTNSTDYYLGNNTIENAPVPAGLTSTKQPNPTTGLSRFLASAQNKKLQQILATRPKGFRMYRDTGKPTGLPWVEFDEYSPRDFRSSLAAYRRAGWGALDLFLMDPKGTKVAAPDWAAVTRDPKDPKRLHIGVAKIDPALGELRPYTVKLTKGRATQVIQGNLLEATWHLQWFRWDEPSKLDPADDAGWSKLFAGKPIVEQTSHNPEWGKVWSIPAPEVPVTNYAFVATSRVKMPSGTYRFAANYAGGMKIEIDGKSVFSNWKDSPWMQYGEQTLELTAGEHEIVVHNYREKGGVFLKFYWGQIQ